MEGVRAVSDRADRIKGLLRPEADFDYSKQIASRYPDPALLVPAQAVEIEEAYKAALEMPISLSRRPHLVLALILYRLGFNPRNSRSAVPLAEWVLKRYRQTHREPATVSDLARAA